MKRNLQIILILATLILTTFPTQGTSRPLDWNAMSSIQVSAVDLSEVSFSIPLSKNPLKHSITGATAGGFIGSMIGSALDANADLKLQRESEDQFYEVVSTILKNLPPDIGGDLHRATTSAISENPTYRSRLSEKSSHNIIPKLSGIGLDKSPPHSNENTVFIFIVVTLTVSQPNKNQSTSWEFRSQSTQPYLPSSLTENPAVLQEALTDCVNQFQNGFSDFLLIKSKRKIRP